MKKRGIKIVIAFVLFLIAFIFKFETTLISNILFILSYLIVGFEIVKKAFRNIIKGKVFDENFLMTVATIGAFFVGEFEEAVAVMLFYQVGELFQSYAVDKSRKSISSLMDIRPDYAFVIKNGKEEKVDPDDVRIGDIILVKPGEKIPLDGIIVDGKSFLDTKALTGESLPREVNVNDEVLSGSINLNSVIKIKVEKEFEESTVSKILDLVENASSKKSKSENFISKFAKYYTPTVVIIAVILAIVPPFFTGMNFSEWIYRALSFLVVSCPCALVISIPLSFFGGIGGASKLGILIKGSNYLEALAKTEVVVFDKTGTLTKGVFAVKNIENFNNFTKDQILKYAAYSENYSNHPIALSIKKEYGEEIVKEKIEKVEEIAGHGILSIVDGKTILVGNDKLLNENNVEYTKTDEIGTIVYVAVDNVYAGFIVVSDVIKEDSKIAIENLKKLNISKTVMLTGDKKQVGEYVAKELGIDEVHTELLPDEKVYKVEQLLKDKTDSGKLVFVGDGINDAPVLAMADIGISMGGIGSDAAIEASDVVLMTDEPSKISHAIKISKKTLKIVKENIIFAIFVKILVLVLTAFGISTMWEAVFADVGVSVIAILNALRMLRVNRL